MNQFWIIKLASLKLIDSTVSLGPPMCVCVCIALICAQIGLASGATDEIYEGSGCNKQTHRLEATDENDDYLQRDKEKRKSNTQTVLILYFSFAPFALLPIATSV